MGKWNSAYYDVDYQNVGNGNWNNGSQYRNDGVDIEFCIDFGSNGYNVGWIENGEWLRYTVKVLQSGIYNLRVNVSSPNSTGQILIRLNGQVLGSIVSVPNTGGWQNWQLVGMNNIFLPAGTHQLETRFYNGGFNFSHIEFELVSTDVEEFSQPTEFKLSQNYPNPFNPATIINFSLAESRKVSLKVYDVLGNLVRILIDDFMEAGNHQVTFDAENLSAGVYYYKLEAGNFTSTKKLILIK
jgi:hypothetical protein